MLMRGKNITASGDPLQPIEITHFFRSIVNPSEELMQRIDQLRIVSTLDQLRYRQLKTTLPYVVCGSYHPAIRKTSSFASIECFILDFDHLNSKNIEIKDFKAKMREDSRILMLFESPSGDGLKVLFKLDEKCYDPGVYRLFYKLFAKSFSIEYGLDQVVDERTSDVTRACFYSYDRDAWLNEAVTPIKISNYLNLEEISQVDALLKEIRNDVKEEKKEEREAKVSASADTLKEIRSMLLPKARPIEKDVFVPEELKGLEEMIKVRLESTPIKVVSSESIQYGKKVKFEMETVKAEVNVFYGKKGFSVVSTTKTGTNPEFAQLCKELLEDLLINRS